jgi:hypothetical protein
MGLTAGGSLGIRLNDPRMSAGFRTLEKSFSDSARDTWDNLDNLGTVKLQIGSKGSRKATAHRILTVFDTCHPTPKLTICGRNIA